jgi:hypothetical protein
MATRKAFTRRKAFVLGYREAHLGSGMTWGDPYTPLSRAYDRGRNWGQRLRRV